MATAHESTDPFCACLTRTDACCRLPADALAILPPDTPQASSRAP